MKARESKHRIVPVIKGSEKAKCKSQASRTLVRDARRWWGSSTRIDAVRAAFRLPDFPTSRLPWLAWLAWLAWVPWIKLAHSTPTRLNREKAVVSAGKHTERLSVGK